MKWTDEEDDRLRNLAAKGLSARQIAERLPGRTRDAIIGRCNRRRIPLGGAEQMRENPDRMMRDAMRCLATGRNGCRVRILIPRRIPLGETCQAVGCTKAPIPNYSHGLCRDCNADRLNAMRTRAPFYERNIGR